MHYSRKWTISYVWPDMSTLMSQLSTWHERHSSDEEISSILQNASLSNRIQGGWLGGGFGPNHFFLILKAIICCIRGEKMPSFPFSPYTFHRPFYLVFIQKAITTRLLSRGIYLHYTLQGRHIFISSKIMFADAIPITLQVCQPCQLVPST